MFCEPHGSTNAAPISTLPELGATEHALWTPILDAESVAAQHQVERKVVRGNQAANEGSGNPGATADEDWPALKAQFVLMLSVIGTPGLLPLVLGLLFILSDV